MVRPHFCYQRCADSDLGYRVRNRHCPSSCDHKAGWTHIEHNPTWQGHQDGHYVCGSCTPTHSKLKCHAAITSHCWAYALSRSTSMTSLPTIMESNGLASNMMPSVRLPRWPMCLCLATCPHMLICSKSNIAWQLSVITKPNILASNMTPLCKATKTAIVFMARHMRSDTNSLKVQTLSSNYLLFIICYFLFSSHSYSTT